MPLIKSASKKAFKKNVETEMKANPDKRAQNLAIAYAVKRRNQPKRMAEGGNVTLEQSEMHNNCPTCGLPGGPHQAKDQMYSQGGEVHQYSKPEADRAKSLEDSELPGMGREDMYDGNEMKSNKPSAVPGGEEVYDGADKSRAKNDADSDEPGVELNLYDRPSVSEELMMKRSKLDGEDMQRYADGGAVGEGEDEHDDMAFSDNSDYMEHPNQPEVEDLEHDAGEVDELPGQSVVGSLLRKRKMKR